MAAELPYARHDDSDTTEGINAPDLSLATLKPKRRAIASAEQAYAIASGLEKNNESRNQKNAIIESKYNGASPHSQGDLRNAGEDWRSNASFGFMSSIIDRIIPVPLKVIDSVKWFTSAGLDPSAPDAERKSEAFREVTTRALRQWDYWKDFIASIVREDVLIGGAFAAWLDDDDPFPRFFRQDEGFVPEGTGQHASTAPFFAAKTEWLIHESVDFIEDKEAADSAGWNIENMVTAINGAMPKTRPENSSNIGTNSARTYEDIVREGNAGMSVAAGARVIEAWHVIASESNGKVTHYIVNRRDKHEILFSQEDRYDKMTDCLCLFTLEQGNSKFYGSKGAGRKLVNDHISIERARNRAIDQVYMSGLVMLKSDPTKTLDIQNKVRFPFVIVGTDASFEQAQVQANVNDFLKLDQFFSGLAEQMVGTYLPEKIDPDDKPSATATEERIDYTERQQAQSASWARFDSQFSNLVSTFQRRLYKKGSTHPVAKESRKTLLEDHKLSDEEIEYLANRPASEVAQDMSQVENQQIIQLFPLLKNDPRIDQQKLYDITIQAMSNARIAKSLVIADQFDPTIEAEQVAKQIIENSVIQVGDSINISPRDNDEIHLKILAHELSKAIPGVQANPDPQVMDNFSAALVHGQAHLDSWKEKGGDEEAIKKYEEAIREADDMLKTLAVQIQQNQQQQQTATAEGMPEPPPQQSPPPIAEHLVKIMSSLSYGDAPPSIQRQIEAAAGFKPATEDGGNAQGNEMMEEPDADPMTIITRQVQSVQDVSSAIRAA